jgi:hypothetical protein
MGEKRGGGGGVGTEVGTGFREIRYRIYLPFNTVDVCVYLALLLFGNHMYRILLVFTICMH